MVHGCSLSPNQDYIPCLLAYCEYPGDPFRRIEDQEGVEFFGCTDEKLFGPDVDLMEASTQAGFNFMLHESCTEVSKPEPCI